MSASILVIEDTPGSLELMAYLLEAAGHTVTAASDGMEGLEMALSRSFDLIVCDIEMPHMTGYQVIFELNARLGKQRPPVIAITAYAMVGDREKVLDAGFEGYLSKPISVKTFIQHLETFLPREKRSSRVTPPHACDTAPEKHPADQGLVLVVDDLEINAELTRCTLQPSGYRVVIADSVEKGMEQVSRNPFDLIISDLHMPQESGIEFLRNVKENPAIRSIPFILITSSMPALDREIERLALSLGAQRFLLRPLAPQIVLEEVAVCVAGRRNA
jgi:two-component system cell cycle response regulator